jgi:transposase InsO family protein
LIYEEYGRAPAISTIHRVLVRHELVQKRRARRKLGQPSASPFKAQAPNELWTVDFKGQFRMRDGMLCYPLTVQDAHSRFLLDCRALSAPEMEPTMHCFRRLFRTFGMPRRIRSDNGQPFASAVSIGRISTLSAWWIQHGVTPELIQPGKPQQNGRHERMHRTLKREATRPPRANLIAQQRAFNRFRHTFNNERPHQALEQRPPASVYRPSDVAFVDPPPSTTYPDHFEIRHVSQLGMIRWKSRFIWVSKVLTHQDVGLEEVGEGLWAVYFGPRRLGWLDEKKNRIMDVRQHGRMQYPPVDL